MDISTALNRNTKPIGKVAATFRAIQNSQISVLMASPPAVTVSAGNGSPAFSNGTSIDLLTGAGVNFNLFGSALWAATYSPNGNNFYLPPPTLGDSGFFGQISFIHDGTQLAVKADGASTYCLFVDGQATEASPAAAGTPTAGVPYYKSYVFGSRARRHCTLFLLGGYGVSGLVIGRNDTIEPLDITTGPNVCFMTDSYGYQAGGLGVGGGPPFEAWNRMGGGSPLGPNFYLSAGGGSGYQTGGTPGQTFNQRLSSLTAMNPDMIVTLGGINDALGGLQAAATTYFAAARAAAPNAILVAGGCWNPNGTSTGSAASKQAAILAALQTVSGPWVFVDNIAGTWQNSSGASGKMGNAPWQTGDGRQITFTGALSAATSGTLTSNWTGAANPNILFSDGTIKAATLASNSTAASWTGAVTAAATAGAYATTQGNSVYYVQTDGTHPVVPAGVTYLGSLLYDAIRSGVLAL